MSATACWGHAGGGSARIKNHTGASTRLGKCARVKDRRSRWRPQGAKPQRVRRAQALEGMNVLVAAAKAVDKLKWMKAVCLRSSLTLGSGAVHDGLLRGWGRSP